MPTADEVIVEFEARVGQYEADLRRSAATFERVTGAQQRQMVALDRQISASSGKIGSAFKGLAALFSAQQVAKLSDDYTRLQNSLRVAGLEGENLESVQARLLDLGGRYGVNINTLADLYGNLSQVSGELGATQAQVLRINEAVAQSLIVTGKSSQEASGAVLGLVQAFGNGKLQAEEWAQINEGGLRPLLEAAAAADKYGGSVQKLRKAVYDGKVTSQEFFQAILSGSQVIESKAANATLTLEGAMTALNNRLVEFVGGAASTSGAAGAIAAGLQKLSENLDTVSNALAVISTIIGVRYVASATAAGVSTIALAAANTRAALTAEALSGATYQANAALLGEAAAANIATRSVTALSVAQGLAARSGGALTALVGGPYGAAILALGAGIYALSQYTRGNTEATGEYAKQQQVAAQVSDRAQKAVNDLATAHGKARDQAIAAARAEQENIKQKYASARASLELAAAELARAKSFQQAQSQAAASAGGTVPGATGGVMNMTGQRAVNSATTNYNAQVKTVNDLIKSFKDIQAALNAAAPVSAPAVDDGKKKKGPKGPKPYERSAEAAERDLARYAIEELQARIDLASTGEERANLQNQMLQVEKAARIAEVKANKDLTAAQKKAALASIERLYGAAPSESGDITVSRGLLGRNVDRDLADRLEREAQDLADEQFRAQQEILRNQYDLADSSADRKRLALASIDLEERYQRAQLEAIIASEAATEAEKERARIALGALGEISNGRRSIANRSNQSPLEAYRDRIDRNGGEINDQIESYVVDELQSVQDSIASGIQKKLGVKDPLLAGLINLFIEQNIIKPFLDSIKGAQGGGFAGLLATVGGIFGIGGSGTGIAPGRAIGGPVTAGRTYKVGENGTELFTPQQSGTIIPNHRLRGGSGAPVINQTFVLDARGGITTPELLEYVNATARRESNSAAGGAYVQSQQSAPGTLNKFNQLRG